jgi:hypothetical protein
MTAIVVVTAVWTLAVALFVLVGAELKRVDAAAELVARRHLGRYGATSLTPPAPSLTRPGRTHSRNFCRRLS